MLSASRSSINRVLPILLLAVPAFAQLPDGPGKAETEKLCSQCHEIERSIAPRQDRAGWQSTIDKMVSLGAKATDKELTAVLDYLALHYPGEDVPKLNINKARAIEIESALSLPRSQAAAIIDYRTKNGNFKTVDDLEKVKGIGPGTMKQIRNNITVSGETMIPKKAEASAKAGATKSTSTKTTDDSKTKK